MEKMKNLLKIKLIAFCFLAVTKAYAQPEIKFTKDGHDFGEVVEGKLASYEFEFTNTGTAPLIIANVQASCGCTSPFWTKEAIPPGKSGKIKASYNSQGRPGPFNKTLTVTSNATSASKMLSIKGVVVSKESKVYTDAEKAASPLASVEKDSYPVGKLEVNQSGKAKVLIKNSGKSPLEISDVQSSCGCVTFMMTNPSIKPGESGIVELTISPRSKGPIKENVTINTNDIVGKPIQVNLTGEAVESMGKFMGGGAVPFK